MIAYEGRMQLFRAFLAFTIGFSFCMILGQVDRLNAGLPATLAGLVALMNFCAASVMLWVWRK
jgi:hypothetical protein